jgi:hypothetical protein
MSLRKLAAALCLLAPTLVLAEGRYQAVPIYNPSDGSSKVLILDTNNGQLWTWMEVGASSGGAGGRFLIYQGQVRPGKRMGDIVEEQGAGR